MYDYLESMKDDIKTYIITDEMKQEIKEDREAVEERLNDELWIDDSITGNASGSYTCNCSRAQEYVTDNGDLVREMVSEFCIESETVAEHFLNEDWEWFDVSIRCYLLGQAISEVLDEIEEEAEETEEI